jgi:uncharacterized membrane protein YfcA
MLSGFEFVLVGLAAVAAGAVNALAGGGTLITFPMLVAVGIPAVAANVTNTVALCPGYFGATLAQSSDLRGQKSRLWLFLPAGVVGGIIGGVLLLNTGERVFRMLVPFLILLASGLLAVQDPLRAWITRRSGPTGSATASEKWAALPVGLAAIYGGYFGAGRAGDGSGSVDRWGLGRPAGRPDQAGHPALGRRRHRDDRGRDLSSALAAA